MAQKISEETEVRLDLKTIGIIVGGVISLTSMYFVLKSDIALAMEKPEPEVSKIEWSYKDELVRSEISNTNDYMKLAKNDEMCNNCLFPDMCNFCSN